MSIKIYKPRDLADFRRLFFSDQACYAHLFEIRQKLPFVCKKCRKGTTWHQIDRHWPAGSQFIKSFLACDQCGHQHSVLAGTRLEHVRIKLFDLCRAFWMVTEAENGYDLRFLTEFHVDGFSLNLGSRKTYYRALDTVRDAMRRQVQLIEAGAVTLGAFQVAPPIVKQKRPSCRFWSLAVLVPTGSRIGVRIGYLNDLSPTSFVRFVEAHVATGADIFSSGWSGFSLLTKSGYGHKPLGTGTSTVDSLFDNNELPKVRRAAVAVESWLDKVGWDKKISRRNIVDYVDEYNFRQVNRVNKGTMFVRLLDAALQPYAVLLKE